MASLDTRRDQAVIDKASSSFLKRYPNVPETTYQLDWADLITLDLSQFDLSGGREKLAAQLKDAVHQIGFFYIKNFGLSQDQIDRQFAIGYETLSLPMEEKLQYRADLESGSYSGYRPLGAIETLPNLRDNMEFYGVFKFTPRSTRPHPAPIRRHLAEIESFHRHVHEDIVYKLLCLIAIILELPEDYLVNAHRYEDDGDSLLRYQRYAARSEEENNRHQSTYLRGHSDFGSLTLVFSQPVAALQIRVPEAEGGWKYVRPQQGSIIVNLADALQFWTNGFLKSSVHRVVAPPADQARNDRLSLLYFVRPSDAVDLTTVDSPLLRRLGLKKDDDEQSGLAAGEWIRSRIKTNWTRDPANSEARFTMGTFSARLFHE